MGSRESRILSHSGGQSAAATEKNILMAFKKPFSISTLLAGSGSRIGALKAGAERARSTLAQVEAALPVELAGTVHAASFEAEGLLTMVVGSGAYASRLRYALPEVLPKILDPEGNPATKGRVQVRPRGTERG